MRIPPTGGSERNVAEVAPGYSLVGYDQAPLLEWTPDGRWLLTADGQQPASLFLISVESGEKKRLTFPPSASMGDLSGAISPDGRTLAFSRNQSGTLGKLCTLEMSSNFTPAGEPNCFTVSDGRLANAVSLRWTPNKREIMFSPLQRGSGQSSLWTITLPEREAVATPQRSAVPSNTARDPVISRDGQRLVYSDFVAGTDIWRLDLKNAGARPVKLIASTKSDHGGQYSPDGKKIVFISNRSGHPELWVAHSDGSNQTQLTTLEAPLVGGPRWSPDGQRVVFDSTLEKQFELYVINADGSGLHRLTVDPAADAAGSWSRDGRWIYFLSKRSGENQIWKMPAHGGKLIQITKHGGGPSIFESTDGRFVYYTKSIGSLTGASTLWRMPVTGGEEVKVLDPLYYLLQWTVTTSGIYFAAPADPGSSYDSAIRFLSFRTGKVTTIAPRESGGQPGISVSPEGRFLLYSFAQLSGSDLMLVENFR
jgi:Tol biopolymer transport system component